MKARWWLVLLVLLAGFGVLGLGLRLVLLPVKLVLGLLFLPILVAIGVYLKGHLYRQFHVPHVDVGAQIPEIKLPQLIYPIRLQYAPGGEILALDGKQRRIVRVAPDGSFSGYLEVKGVPGEGAVIPRSFRVDSAGSVYLLDIFGERVIQVDKTGNFQRQIPFPAGYGFCTDLAVDSRGGVILLDSVRAMLYSVARDGAAFAPLTKELHEYGSFPTTIALDSRGTIYLGDRNDGGIMVIGPDGSFQRRQLNIGQKNGFLLYPGQICFDSRDTLFVADTANNRVQLFSSGK